MSFNLEDFIPVYPEQDDPEIQYKIGTKKEFIDVSAEISEAPPRPGDLYMHQKAFKRYMMNQDKILNIQSVGTGKTCAMISIAEQFKNDSNFNNRVYVILRGPSLQQEIKKQIACDCTDKVYLTESVTDSSKDEISRMKALTRNIHERYQFRTYSSFAKEILKTGFLDEEIDRIYSGCIFLVDEAHYLNEKRQSKQYKNETGEELDVDPTNPDDFDKEEDYKTLWKFFHKVKRCKIILSTATPMINDVKEIANIMNLILPMDMQMPVNWNYDKMTIEQLEPFLRGRVSYVKAFETGADVSYEGLTMNRQYEMEIPVENQDIPFLAMKRNIDGDIIYEPKEPNVKTKKKIYKSQSVIYPTLMSNFQKNAYEKAVTESRNFRQSEKQASCFVFPDSSYGGDFISGKKLKAAAGKFIKTIGVDKYELEPEFKQDVKRNIEQYSSKYSFIIANELDAAEKRKNGEIVGTSFCYSEIKSGGGAILLGKVLEEFGFEQFDENISVFGYTKSGNKNFCSDDKSSEKVIRSTFTKKLRYAILSTTMSDEKRQYLFEIFNSPENANGDYVQLMIGTEASREGINVFSVLRGYLLTPGWHPSGVHQALARFIRAKSHIYIINLIRKKLSKEGKDPAFAKTEIKVYKLAAIVEPEEINEKITISLTDFDKNKYTLSADLDLYTIIERKDISIKRMMNILKRCAFDCPIHYTRNTSGNDKDGSEKCDYEKCKYICYPSGSTNDISEEEVDYSTFDILYSQEYMVNECREIIVRMLSKRNSVRIKDLFKMEELKVFKKKYIIMAIDEIIKRRLFINNRFGFPSFINMDSNYLFCQTEFPNFDSDSFTNNNANLNLYKDILFGYKQNSFADIIKELSVDEDNLIFKNIMNLNDPLEKQWDEFNRRFDNLTKKYQLIKIEEAFMDVVENKGNTLSEAIFIKFKRYFKDSPEPKNDIYKIQKYLETSNLRRGRNRKENACPIIDESLIGGLEGPDKNEEIIYIHTINFDTDTTSFKTNAQFFNPDFIRIYKPSEKDGWRNTHTYECQAYKNIIRIQNEARIKPLVDKFEYIGTIIHDSSVPEKSVFRIIKSRDFRFDANDKRSTSKGTVCSSFGHKFDLINILLESEYYHDDIESVSIPQLNKDDIIKELIKIYKVNLSYEELNKFKLNELRYIMKWFVSGLSKSDICIHVQSLFEEEERLISI
jgi:hypothetical protein